MTQATLIDLLIGFLLAALTGLAAWRAKALQPLGALAAALLGTIVFGLGGLGWAILLLGFFISSSLLSRLARKRKQALDEKFSKGSQRDAGQVAANGGLASLFVLGHLLAPTAVWPWLGFAGAMAAANADTWATELGVLSRSAPRLITTGKRVERGASGGVSFQGILAALAGSLLIALLAVLFWQGHVFGNLPGAPAWLARMSGGRTPTPGALSILGWLVWITLAGLVGSLVDSLLGATLQAIYYCPTCQKETEHSPRHTCGTPTLHIRGWAWLNNDWVNAACTLAGAIIAVAGMWLR